MAIDAQFTNREGGPMSLDEGWWAALMQDAEAHAPDSPKPGEAPPRPRSSAREDAAVDWAHAKEIYEQDRTVDLPVVGFNRGGLLVALNSLRGFVPASHLIGINAQIPEEERKDLLAARMGQTLCLKVIEYDPTKGRVVLSERAAQAGPGRRAEVLERLHPGDIVRGSITNVTDFGAFIDLGGLEGLVHVSEISWGRVNHPGDVLCCGKAVEVYVLSIDREQARVALSIKRLLPDPWATVNQRYTIGQVVEGTITNVVNFGAFACIEDGLEGLIHVSELGEGQFMHPRNVVQEGERVKARIVSIDGQGRRLGLSLRWQGGDGWSQPALQH